MKTLFNKVLLLNGCPVIQYCGYGIGQESPMFVQGTRLLFVSQGCCKLRYGMKEWELRRNEMALLRRAISVDFHTGMGAAGFTGNKYLFFDLSPELLQEFVRMGEWRRVEGGDFSAIATGVADEKMLTYIESLASYFNDSGKWSAHLIKLKLLELLFFLADSAPALFAQLLDLRRNFRPDIRATVEENIGNGLSLPELAVLSGRSLSSFRRDFQAIYNMPPSQWMRQKRLEKARKLLMSTTMSVTDICYTLGFENLTNFCRLFKSHFGRRPLELKASDKSNVIPS